MSLLKLSNPDYFLPHVEALEAGKILSSGRTRPTIIRGVCVQTSVKSDYVVKFKGSPEMYPGANCKELLAALIALELDLNVATPAIINISPYFLETLENGKHESFKVASNSIGFNFGNLYEGQGFLEPMNRQIFSDSLLTYFSDLLAFDIFIGNPDRRKNKPNFLTNGTDVLIFDHEMAFSFLQLLPFLRNSTPYLIPDSDLAWINQNYCFNLLKGKNLDFSTFATRLKVLDGNFWRKAIETIPQEWDIDSLVENIKNYLEKIIQNKEQFASELNRILL